MVEEGEEIRVRLPRKGELFGVVEQMLGSSNIVVRCEDGKTRKARIRGKMRKRIWIRTGNLVLVKPWIVQSDKWADVVWRYSPTQASWIKRKGLWKG